MEYKTYLRFEAGRLGIPCTPETKQFLNDLLYMDYVSIDQDIESLKQYAEYLRVRGNPALIAASRLTNPKLLAPFEDQLRRSVREILSATLCWWSYGKSTKN